MALSGTTATFLKPGAHFARGFDDRVQTPLEYVTEWRMQKAVQLLQRHDKKLIDVAHPFLLQASRQSGRR